MPAAREILAPGRPRRIRIVGTSGSGKTHLARRVATVLALPHLELDAVFWSSDWTLRDADEARAIVRSFLAANSAGWVIDGGWTSRLDGLLELGTPGGPDLVVWLDHPRVLVMSRVIRRTLRRTITREELWHGNTEPPTTWVRWDADDNIIRWAWVQHARLRTRFADRREPGFVRLSGQPAVRRWLRGLAQRTDAEGSAAPH